MRSRAKSFLFFFVWRAIADALLPTIEMIEFEKSQKMFFMKIIKLPFIFTDFSNK